MPALLVLAAALVLATAGVLTLLAGIILAIVDRISGRPRDGGLPKGTPLPTPGTSNLSGRTEG